MTPTLFDMPRQKRRHLMHVIDAGMGAGGQIIARFRCGRCDAETEWLKIDNVTEGKRGIPCEACNKTSASDNTASAAESDIPASR